MQRMLVNLAQHSAIATHTLRLAIDPGKGEPDKAPQCQRDNGRAGPDGVACRGMRVARRRVKEDVSGRRHVEEVSLCIIAHSVLSSWHGEVCLTSHCSCIAIPAAKLACAPRQTCSHLAHTAWANRQNEGGFARFGATHTCLLPWPRRRCADPRHRCVGPRAAAAATTPAETV